MTKKCLTILLAGLLVFSANALFVPAQSNTSNDASKIEKIKTSVRKRGTDGKEKVSVKMLNGTKLKGFITQSDEDSFTIKDAAGQSSVIAYKDVSKVGTSGMSKGAKIALGVGIAATATVTVLYIAFQNVIKDN